MRSIYLCLLFLGVLAMLAGAVNSGLGAKPDNAAARGAYIVNRVSQCPHCHTPRLISGELNAKRWLAGAPILMKPTIPVMNWAGYAPNLTPAGFLRRWNSGQLERFLMTSKDSSGGEANPPMPPYRLNKADAEAVRAYLRSLPVIK